MNTQANRKDTALILPVPWQKLVVYTLEIKLSFPKVTQVASSSASWAKLNLGPLLNLRAQNPTIDLKLAEPEILGKQH